MDTNKQQSLPAVLKLIWGVQLASCGVLAALIYFEFIPPAADSASLAEPFYALAVLAALAGPIIKRKLCGDLHAPSVPREVKEQKYFTATLIGIVLSEAAAVLGFVSYLQGGSSEIALGLCLLAAISVFLCAPNEHTAL